MKRTAILLVLALWSTQAVASCRLALVLALDVSGSVDRNEYRLQLDGLAAALDHAAVREALLALPEALVDVTVFEWSAPEYQRLLVPWTSLRDDAALDTVIAGIRATERQPAPRGTALGTALQVGAEMLGERSHCWQRILDVSGDGKHNNGPHPRDQHPRLEKLGATVNALVIGVGLPKAGDRRHVELAELTAYFRAYVISGPGAFVETAMGFEDYEAAMVRKLLRELNSLSLAQAHIQ